MDNPFATLFGPPPPSATPVPPNDVHNITKDPIVEDPATSWFDMDSEEAVTASSSRGKTKAPDSP
jgi:hypothetical protein